MLPHAGMAFPVWLRSRLLSAVLEPVFSQTEKSCITLNYRQFSRNIKIKIKKIPVLFVPRGRRLIILKSAESFL